MRFDLVAGVAAAAVVLPKAMAYATVAGLPVAVGLYTAFIPMVVYALLGWAIARLVTIIFYRNVTVARRSGGLRPRGF